MKQNENYLLKDPWLSVDPNSILDYGPKTLEDPKEEKFNLKNQPSTISNDWAFDYLNYSDSQLESLINLNDFDFDNLPKDLVSTMEEESADEKFNFAFEQPQLNQTEFLNDLNEKCFDSGLEYFNGLMDHDYDGANIFADEYEELSPLYSPLSEATDELKSIDAIKSEIIEESTIFETNDTAHPKRNKRKQTLDYGELEAETRKQSKAKQKRPRRNTSELVQYRNKIAALRYREKKREEKIKMEDILEKEQAKNDLLNSQVEELTMKIKVFKELLSNYIKKE